MFQALAGRSCSGQQRIPKEGRSKHDQLQICHRGYLSLSLCRRSLFQLPGFSVQKIGNRGRGCDRVCPSAAHRRHSRRWIESYRLGFGHAPLSNMYESLVFFSWCITLIYLLWDGGSNPASSGLLSCRLPFLPIAYAALAPGFLTASTLDPGLAEQLAPCPCHYLFSELCLLCHLLRRQHHVSH